MIFIKKSIIPFQRSVTGLVSSRLSLSGEKDSYVPTIPGRSNQLKLEDFFKKPSSPCMHCVLLLGALVVCSV